MHASEAYNRGDLAGASSRLDAIINEYPDATQIAEAYYIRGLCRTQAGQLQGAAEDFEAAINKSQRSDLGPLSQVGLASIAFRQGNWVRAAELYEAALKSLPDSPPTDQIAYNAGVSLQRAGRWKDASTQFGRLLRVFPNSSFASGARRLNAWPYEYFTVQLAVYSKADSGAQAVQAYKSRNLDAYVQSMTRDGRVLWVVMTGRYPTYNDAAASLNYVRRIEPQAFILP